MTAKLLPFSGRSRSNCRENRDTSRHRSPTKSSYTNSKPHYGSNDFKPPSKSGSPYQIPPSFQKELNYNNNNTNSNTFRPQSPNYNRDGNRSRQPFSRNYQCNVRNYIEFFLDQEQTEDTISITEIIETQNVSEEQLLDQQFNDLLLELNQDTQDE